MHIASHQQLFARHPLAHLAAAFAVGTLATQLKSTNLSLLFVTSPAALLSALSLLFFIKSKSRLTSVCIFLTFVCLGASFALVEKQNVPANSVKRLIEAGTIEPHEPVELTGTIDGPPEYAPGNLYLTLRVEKLRLGNVDRNVVGVIALMLAVPENTNQYRLLGLRHGARIRVMTTLNRTDNFRNPGVTSLTEYLDRKGYDATGFVKSPALIERLDDTRVFLPLAWLYQWRQLLSQKIHESFSLETAGVLDAALLGNRHGLSRPTAERFREGGTFHVLVISGLHISFLGGLVLLFVRRLTRNGALQFVISTAVVWAYTLAVGAEASVVRAAFMFTFVALAPLLARRAASLNALGAAALLLLAWRPSDLLDPSFQLTFLSVVAIVALAWPSLEKMTAIGSWRPTRETPYPPAAGVWLRQLSELLYWSEKKWRRERAQLNYNYRLFKTPLAARLERYHLQRLLRYIFAAIVVSLCVQLTLLPLLIIYFHRLSIASLVLNIGVSLLMAAVCLVALAALFVALISSKVAAPLIVLVNALNWLMLHLVDPFTATGVASLRLPEYSGWATLLYVLYFVPLLVLANLLFKWNPLAPFSSRIKRRRDRRWLRVAGFTQVWLVILIVAHPLSSGSTQGRLRLDFLDVGQGDAALVTFPDGTTLLIDAGGKPNFSRGSGQPDSFERDSRAIGEAVVSQYLWQRGLSAVDYVLATHADADHIDGLNDVARNFRVRAALVGRAPTTDPEYARFAHSCETEGIPVTVLAAGDVLQVGGTTATVLWPPANASPEAPSRNNDSLVVRLEFGARRMLLTGDIEAAAEAALVRGGANLQADIVKVAHHGSKTSSTEAFVLRTGGRYAIISVGLNSMFGHPHKEVVEQWKARGAEILTTGRSGTITVSTDGSDLRLETFVER